MLNESEKIPIYFSDNMVRQSQSGFDWVIDNQE